MQKKYGFTLVELSIVLVIIGLLIGGILAAQSMIQTTKIQAFVRQIQGYDILVSNFKNKYKSLPGDSTLFSPVGNGNGLIEADQLVDTDNFYPRANNELGNFWKHLDDSGAFPDLTFINTNIGDADLPTKDITSGTTLHWPRPVIGSKEGGIGVSSNGSVGCLDGSDDSYNCYIVSDFPGSNYEESNGTVEWQDVLAYDKKVDDGLPSTGITRNYCTGGPNIVDPTYSPCRLMIKVAAQTGEDR